MRLTRPLRRAGTILTTAYTSAAQLASLLLAAECRLCGELLESFTRQPVCDACLGRIRPMELLAWCDRCQRPVSLAAGTTSDGLCGPCREGETRVTRLRSFGTYEGELRDLIALLKYEGVRTAARPLAGLLALAMEYYPEMKEAEVIVPVPLHRTRQRRRGFNQAALIARELGRWTGLRVEPDWLRRTEDTPSQTGLTVRQRAQNVRGVFQSKQNLDRKRILLIDDVCTTGATLNACAGALRKAGAEAVLGLTVARVLQEIT